MKIQFKALLMIGVWFFITSCEKEDAEPGLPALELTSVHPYDGNVGHIVKIYSNGRFSQTSSENVVKFNGTEAIIESSTERELIVSVPLGATTGRITVTVNGESVTSGREFEIKRWTQLSDFPGSSRGSALGFSIGHKGYFGLGSDGSSSIDNEPLEKDLWEYNADTDSWTQKADYPGWTEFGGTSFVIGEKGYFFPSTVTLRSNNPSQFWEYDPAVNQWTNKADFHGGERTDAVGFSIGDKGYIGTGRKRNGNSWDHFKDFWEYNPASDQWVKRADFEGEARGGAVGFAVGNKGYIGAGSAVGSYYNDFWEYDPDQDTWIKKSDINMEIEFPISFVIEQKALVKSGVSFWEYNPTSDQWMERAKFPNENSAAAGFAIGKRGYIITGSGSAAYNDHLNYKTVWEYYSPE